MIVKTIYDDVDCYDIEDLINEIKIARIVVLKNNPRISMANGGDTSFYEENGDFYSFSSGQNWSDQARQHLTREEMIERLQEALDGVADDFEKYAYDTRDSNACYLEIHEREKEYEDY